MSDYKVGYQRPPLHSRFKPGQSGNPKGRAFRKPRLLAEQINDVLNEPRRYHENGRRKVSTWTELSLRMLVARAVRGDVVAARDILRIWLRAERRGDGGSRTLRIENWLPDHPGQTAEEKARTVQDARHAEPIVPPSKSLR